MFTQNLSITERTFSTLEPTPEIRTKEKSNYTVQDAIKRSCESITPFWPLANFIAANPLKGFESLPFEKAIKLAEKYFHGVGLPRQGYFHEQFHKGRITPEDLSAVLRMEATATKKDILEILIQQATESKDSPNIKPIREEVFLLSSECCDQLLSTRLYSWSQVELTKWAAAYFDLGQGSWQMPNKQKGFYQSWRELAPFDRSFEFAGVSGFRKFVHSLPNNPLEAIEKLCKQLGIPEELLYDYFLRHFAALPGWSGLFAYYGNEQNFLQGTDKNSGLVDWLAVRLAYDAAGTSCVAQQALKTEGYWTTLIEKLKKRVSTNRRAPEKLQGLNANLIWLEAFEHHYRKELAEKLGKRFFSIGRSEEKRPSAQAVFCIDVRSEGFRRHLEGVGEYETYGFAGFFAIPMAFRKFGSNAISAQCPVLLRPKYLVTEELESGSLGTQEGYEKKIKIAEQLGQTLKEVKSTSVSPFSFVETLGGFASLGIIGRSFTPGLFESIKSSLRAVSGLSPRTQPNLKLDPEENSSPYLSGIPLADQVAIAENSLRFIGLTRNFAQVVLLCGHGSETQNNAYASGLDCGACGGHAGAPNSRVAAAIFNSPQVRLELAGKGISIPKDTWFIAAEHNTTNDRIQILDEGTIPPQFEKQILNLKSDLSKAGKALNHERTRRFDQASPNSIAEVTRRTQDWSEVRPEWGLAGNAAFIIARRELTKGLDLACRTFLHSYRWEEDKEGKALEVILTAPMVVTQWINAQYYFSSTDPAVFGSGNKTIHNIVGKIGVMEGNVSDLKIGLPFQSVHDGKALQHEPMRLAVFIEAPLDRIRQIVKKHEAISTLVSNGWIHLIGMHEKEGAFRSLGRNLEWDL